MLAMFTMSAMQLFFERSSMQRPCGRLCQIRLQWKFLATLSLSIGLAGMHVRVAASSEPVAPTAPRSGETSDERSSELEREASWKNPTPEEVRNQVLQWLNAVDVPADVVARARLEWPDTRAMPDGDLLDHIVLTVAIVEPRAERLLKAAHALDRVAIESVPVDWIEESVLLPVRDMIRLWLGREYSRRSMFDEGILQLAELDLMTSVDPATLLFHRAACQYWLLDAEAAIESIDTLLERAEMIPVRYERLARLLRADATSLESESLDHIARRMRDITRRLDLGRAGPKTRGVQDGVIESLDKLITAIEKQQQEQNQSGSGGTGSGKGGSGQPMQDSRPAGGKGPGEVTRRDLGDGEGWGDLPPHKREEALQQITREFPAHYREVIEQYFKRLATEEP